MTRTTQSRVTCEVITYIVVNQLQMMMTSATVMTLVTVLPHITLFHKLFVYFS